MPLFQVLGLRRLTAVLVGLIACGEPRDEPVVPAKGTIRLLDGHAETLGEQQHHVRHHTTLAGPDGELVVTLVVTVPFTQSAWIHSRLRQGDVLPAFGVLHRVIELSKKAVVLAIEQPVPGTDFADTRSLVVGPGARLTFWTEPSSARPLFVELENVVPAVDGNHVAHLRTYNGPQPIYVVKPEDFTASTITTAEALLVHGRRHRITAVRPADPARRLPPFIEIDPTAH